ncbi:MAG: DNA mismatch repair endonuclease MutL [Bacteroidales bacterium]|jgi:DNA mismatch repair protein MutL
MSDLIKILDKTTANQIAAGEVVQRPSSVVKELLENAIDAKASVITLSIKDAGRLLIQVVDNGIGMSENDAENCFNRHATSKISSSDDLFSLNTLGFRGEALAAIAAVSQIELKTKRENDELGTKILIEGGKIISKEKCVCDKGTSISVKNIFFNVPVRRNFLKSNNQEQRFIYEEFNNVALINTSVKFVFYNNEKIIFDLLPSSFKERIVNLINKTYNEKLIPIEAETKDIKISGFVCKPEFARKTKGSDQFFFVNNRYIRHGYLRHAVESAYQELIPADMYPMYFIKIELEPDSVDVNIHPTKTEVNFKDATMIYAFLRSTIKQAFATFSLKVPSIDFDVNPNFNIDNLNTKRPIISPESNYNPKYNPFDGLKKQTSSEDWEQLYSSLNDRYNADLSEQPGVDLNKQSLIPTKNVFEFEDKFIQYKNKYIIGVIDKGIIIIDQSKAHERILYEEYLKKLETKTVVAQTDMFPETITFNIEESSILDVNKELFEKIGFVFEKLGTMSYVFKAHPSNLKAEETKNFVESILEDLKNNISNPENTKISLIAKTTARKLSVKEGTKLKDEEMKSIAENLFKCKITDNDLDGNPTYAIIDMDAVSNFF